MKYLFLSLTALSLLVSCNSKPGMTKRTPEQMAAHIDSLKAELLKTDIAFSQLSEEKGRNAAFLEYAADNVTVLRPYSMPISNKDTLAGLFKDHPDSSYTLTWVPISADVARSGDLGYTYGTYSLDIKNAGKEEGTYCTIWKKSKDHQWKYVMDTGNEGLKREDKATNKEIKAEVKEMKKGKKK